MTLEHLKWKWLYARVWLAKRFAQRHRLNHRRICVDITFNCNLKCYNCNRSCRQAPSYDRMTLDQVAHFLEESRQAQRGWTHIMIEGGEPTLHPHFLEIVAAVIDYRRSCSPATQIILSTNGYGDEVQRILPKVPQEVIIYNSKKTSPERAEFDAFNMAPVDREEYRGADFTRACYIPTFWGIGLTRYGYYPCSVSGGIDRVFGFDIGRQTVPSSEDPMHAVLRTVCRYCGHFIRFNTINRREEISESWAKAYEAFKENPPVLTVYGGKSDSA